MEENEDFSHKEIRISAEDNTDLDIFSACLQDALVPLAGFIYDAPEHRFHLIANRFCWECHHSKETKNDENHSYTTKAHRVQSHAYFDHVTGVKKRGFHPNTHPHTLFNLLAIQREGEGNVIFYFSGGFEIKLNIEKLKCYLRDIDEPIPTTSIPQHVVIENTPLEN